MRGVFISGKYKDFLPDAQAAISSTPRSTGDLKLPDSNNSINVPMPPGQSQQQSSGSGSDGGLMLVWVKMEDTETLSPFS